MEKVGTDTGRDRRFIGVNRQTGVTGFRRDARPVILPAADRFQIVVVIIIKMGENIPLIHGAPLITEVFGCGNIADIVVKVGNGEHVGNSQPIHIRVVFTCLDIDGPRLKTADLTGATILFHADPVRNAVPGNVPHQDPFVTGILTFPAHTDSADPFGVVRRVCIVVFKIVTFHDPIDHMGIKGLFHGDLHTTGTDKLVHLDHGTVQVQRHTAGNIERFRMGNTVGSGQQNDLAEPLPLCHTQQTVQTVGSLLRFLFHFIVIVIFCIDHFTGTVAVGKGQPFRQGATVSATEFGAFKPTQMIFPIVFFTGDNHHIFSGRDLDLFCSLFHQRDGVFPAFSFGIDKMEDPVIPLVGNGGIFENRQMLFLHPECFFFGNLGIGFGTRPKLMINLIGASSVHIIC